MKKFIFCLLSFSVAVFCSTFAAEKVVWTGDEPISWNTEVYEGTQFETPDGIFAGLKEQDTIRVSVVAHLDEPQYVITYKAGDSWTWTDIDGLAPVDGVIAYIVPDETIASEIATRGLVFRGQGYNITQIAVATEDEPVDPIDPVDPGVPYVERTVWTGDVAISWNQEVYAGTEFDTYTAQADMLAGLQENDSIKFFYAEAIEGAQFALAYKAGDDWTWTDLKIKEADGFFAYRVASEELAMDIADHGLVIRGQGYHLARIVIGTPEQTEGVEEIVNRQSSNRKYIKDGQLVIIREEKEYSILGQIIK